MLQQLQLIILKLQVIAWKICIKVIKVVAHLFFYTLNSYLQIIILI